MIIEIYSINNEILRNILVFVSATKFLIKLYKIVIKDKKIQRINE